MKEYAKLKKISTLEGMPSALRSIGAGLISTLFGFICSQVKLMSTLTPLGVILAASLPTAHTLTSGIGAFFGYLFLPVSDTPFRYVAALFASVSIRLLTVGIKKLAGTPPFCAFTVLVSLTVCNLVTLVSGAQNVLLLLSEGVLAGGLTYFVTRAISVDITSGVGLSGEELASMVITVDLVFMALVPVTLGGFSIGRTLTAVLILAASRFGGVSGGAISGTAVGFAVALCQNDAKLVCLYALSGLVSGLFSSSRIMGILGFLVPSFISIGTFGIDDTTLAMIIEILLGIAVFLLLPKRICIVAAALFSPPVRLESLEGMRKSLVMRLKRASSALCDVSSTIDEVAKRLKRINSPDPSSMFTGCEETVCVGCSFRINCWETERHATFKALGLLSDGIREGNSSLRAVAPDFAKKCLRPDTLEETLKRLYSEYLGRLSAEERIDSVRGVVSDQFDGISDMLLDLSHEFDTARRYDLDTAEIVVSALREIGLLTTDCSCATDKYGRMSIEAKLHSVGENIINRKRILDQLQVACERRFEPPTVQQVDNVFYITITERANITPEVGVMQLPANELGVCGDAYSYFGDGSGKYYMLISDGMGTGGRAAVDGAMTAGLTERLLKAGFGFDCSLRIVNSALLYKSSEESLSTVDIACIDLYTGETELYKAGAAPTLVRRSGKVGRAESHSLPVGILRDVGFDRSTITLKHGDAVILLSDGATTAGTDWISQELEENIDLTAQQLAERIAEAARRRADGNHPDDITVMVTLLNEKL